MAINLSNLDAFFEDAPQQEPIEVAQVTNCSSIPEIMEKALNSGLATSPLDIRAVVKKIFEIEVIETDLGRSVSGFLERISNKWHIYINKNESEVRKRFTIAHELGHFLHHRDMYVGTGISAPDQIFFRDDSINSVEREANEFAAELLMPKESFKRYIADGCNTIDGLADKFKLSTSAIKYRAYKLGFLSEYK